MTHKNINIVMQTKIFQTNLLKNKLNLSKVKAILSIKNITMSKIN